MLPVITSVLESLIIDNRFYMTEVKLRVKFKKVVGHEC